MDKSQCRRSSEHYEDDILSRVTLTVTVRVSRVSVMVSVMDSVNMYRCELVNKAPTSAQLPIRCVRPGRILGQTLLYG